MNCREILAGLQDHLDQELEPSAAGVFEAHLAACPTCAHRARGLADLKQVLRGRASLEPVPAGLSERIAREIRERRVRDGRLRRLALAAMAVAACGLLLAGLFRPRAGAVEAPPFGREMVDDHIRYVAVAEPAEFASGDPAAIEGWFSRQVDFAVDLPEFEFRAIGGRRCYLLDRRVALVFYGEGPPDAQTRHSLFVLPMTRAELDAVPWTRRGRLLCTIDTHKGYTVLCWRERELLYALVSPESEEEILRTVESAPSR